MSYDNIEQLHLQKCKSCNFKRRCTAANKSHIFFQERNKIIEHMLKNVNLAILHRSLSRTMSHEKTKNTNLALVLNMIFFFQRYVPRWNHSLQWDMILYIISFCISNCTIRKNECWPKVDDNHFRILSKASSIVIAAWLVWQIYMLDKCMPHESM